MKNEQAQHASLNLDFVRSQFPGLEREWVYFDNAGGSQILKGAVERMTRFLFENNVQNGGSYALSQAVAKSLLEARTAAATLMNAPRPQEIVFGPSTTVLLQNLARAMRRSLSPGDEIVVTCADHESNIGPWDSLREFGIVIKTWHLDKSSMTLRIEDLEPLMSDRTRLVCVTHVSNILGEINPIADYARFVHQRGALICVDGVAYAPHRAIDVQEWDVDYYVFSLYKTFGPHYAVMYGKYELLLELDTLYHYFYAKEKVPEKLETGNPSYEAACSVVGILSYLVELGERSDAVGSDREKVVAAFDLITRQETLLVARFLKYLKSRDDFLLIGREGDGNNSRVPTIAFKVRGWNSGELARRIDDYNVAIRFGDFHSRRLIEYLDLAGSEGVVRVSMVHYNTVEEVDRLTSALDEVLQPEGAIAEASA